MTVKEAAKRLRLTESTIRAWILNNRIQYVKLGRRVFIREKDLDKLLHCSLVPVQHMAMEAQGK